MHTAVTAQFLERPATRPVFLVGVAEQALFWKDIRRVLFSGSSYRILARLGRSGLQTSWTPVKLVDVIRDVIPNFAKAMDKMNRDFLAVMSSTVASHRKGPPAHLTRTTSVVYAMLLGERFGIEISEDELIRAGLLNTDPINTELTVRDWRAMLAPITALIEDRSGRRVDPELAANYRVAAVTQAGLLDLASTTNAVGTQPDDPDDAQPDGPEERFLDSEIVAIYW